jgi:hypothetical protein
VIETPHAIQADRDHTEPDPVTCGQRPWLRERYVEPATIYEAGYRIEIGLAWSRPSGSASASHDWPPHTVLHIGCVASDLELRVSPPKVGVV